MEHCQREKHQMSIEFQNLAEPQRKSRKGTSFHGCWEGFLNTNVDHMCG